MIPGAMAIVLAASGIGALHSSFKPVSMRLETTGSAEQATLVKPAQVSSGAPAVGTPNGATLTPAEPFDVEALGTHINLPQAKALFDQGFAFADAREEHERGEGWISGSVHLTPSMMTGAKLPDSFDQLDPGAAVVIYCAGGTCDASENLAILLKQAGFKKLHVFTDGFPAWKGAGYPIENSSGVESGPGGGS